MGAPSGAAPAGREIRVRGTGRVEVAAFGVGDAEHLVEKELARLWPEARVRVLEARRTAAEPRLVEEFAVGYRLDATVHVAAADLDEARRAAFRHARERLRGSRYARTEWQQPQPG